MGPLAPLYGDVGTALCGQNSRSRFGHDGKAQLADGLQVEDAGEAGERENLDEVVRGGEGSDFKGILIGFTPVDRGEGVKETEEDGDDDISVRRCAEGNMDEDLMERRDEGYTRAQGLSQEEGWLSRIMMIQDRSWERRGPYTIDEGQGRFFFPNRFW